MTRPWSIAGKIDQSIDQVYRGLLQSSRAYECIAQRMVYRGAYAGALLLHDGNVSRPYTSCTVNDGLLTLYRKFPSYASQQHV
jgi:hypothetical protein